MNLDQIATKCFILALFIRDDGQRLLLGDGYYDFNQKLQHFQGNTIANDIVEIQGDSGQLLAGQVMRSGAQKFEGYIGDATTSRQIIEQKRSDFMAFFRIKHFYKVIYIFPDGTAIQRQRGYLTDAPTIPEIFQKFPEYSVALNFEDANYYEYAEDDHGDEIYAHIAELALAGEAIGGLIWDEIGAVTNGITWSGIQTAQGEYIQITNSLDIPAKLASVEMLGNAEQTTYSGKNLARPNANGTTAGVSFVWNSDGTITLNGTATGAADLWIANGGSGATEFTIPSGTQLTQSLRVVSGSASANTWAVRTILYYGGSMHWGDVIGNKTFTASSETQVRGLEILLPSGLTFNSLRLEIQLEKSATATTWEKYVGGTPAPNPELPMPISVVTGENVVKIEGKNLCYETRLNGTNNILFFIDKPASNTMTFSATINAVTSGNSIYLRVDDLDKGLAGTITGGANTRQTSTLTLSDTQMKAIKNGRIVYLMLYKNNAGFTLPTEVQVENGPELSDYEPYHGQSFEINLGKNLFDPFIISTSGITVEEDGTLKLSDNTSAIGYKQTGKTLAQLAPSLKVGDTVYLYLETDWTGKQIYGSHIGNWTNGQYRTITAEMLADSIIVYGGYQTTSTIRIMITKNLDSTYAPYFTPIELAKIGNYQDRIYKEDSKWYIEKQVGKKVFDGSEPWETSTYGTNSWALSGLLFPFDTSKTQIISNIFRGVSNDDRATAGENIIYSGSTNAFYIRNTTLTTLASVQSATSGNYVYYALATPTTTEITNEALIAQLDALGASSLYVGLNNIGTETLNAMPTLKIEYYTEYTLDGAGYEWEPGGNTAKTIVTVAGVDSAWPIWTIQGGAQNPTLTNITTGQTISWQGFVPEGQTLTINMAEMTADLAGANVFEYITGEWLRLAPGNNTLVYNAGNADKPSTLSWNGVLA